MRRFVPDNAFGGSFANQLRQLVTPPADNGL